MKIFRISLSAVIVLIALLVAIVPALAALPPMGTYSFTCITGNNAGNCAAGQAQLFVQLYCGPDTGTGGRPNLGANQVAFSFFNLGPAASSITDVYFDDGTLLGIATIYNYAGVDFSQYASPPNLPGGQNVSPPFVTTAGFLADSNPPAQPNGVNPNERLDIVFNLQSGLQCGDTYSQLASGALRIGIHVQGFANGGSESFVNNGVTAVDLASFDAKSAKGGVTLKWVTGTELSNAGFNVYRAASMEGAREKLSGSLIAANGDAASGASYSFIDKPGYGTFYYWLEDVDLNGTTTLHGPVSVKVASSIRPPLVRPVSPTK